MIHDAHVRMHDDHWGYPGLTKSDLHYMQDPVSKRRTAPLGLDRDLDLAGKRFSWGRIPERIDPTKVLRLVLENDDESVVTIPEAVHKLTNLIWLHIPGRFVPHLEADSIPPSIRALVIQGEGTHSLPEALCLPGLERLERQDKAILRFRAEQIPNVQHLSIQLDPRGGVLREVTQMTRLTALDVGPISNRAILEGLTKLPLRYLRLEGGNLDTIDPIRDCPTLTDVSLFGLSRLTSLAPLADLPGLRELSILWCKRLVLDRSLLRIAGLRKLSFFACRDIGLEALRPELEARGLEKFATSSTH